ncbi:MAG: hypothetical protein ACE15C_19725 [Phycisphaerae bacterium]
MTKIAFIGSGSYTFGPSILKQAFIEDRLDGIELALVDLDKPAVELMAAVARRLAASAGLRAKVTAHTEREKALDGADFVICSAAVQGLKRFNMDVEIAHRLAPGHLITEFGGVAGISYSLRQIHLITSIAADMRRLCPDAWLLDCANPLPRVCQAAHESGVKTAGFCSVSSGFYGTIWKLLNGVRLRYPWADARDKWTFVAAGLNHFSWLLEMKDIATGHDLIDLLRRRLDAGGTVDEPRCEQVFREVGTWLLPCDDHVKDFLPPTGVEAPRTHAFHGDAAERQERREHLTAVAEGRTALNVKGEAWERPVDLIASMLDGRQSRFNSINLINAGQIANLPRNVFVETPAVGTKDGPKPRELRLPPFTLPYTVSAAAVTDTIVQAALKRSVALVHKAVELDPTVQDKGAGLAAIDECLKAHADVLPAYS